MPVDGHQEQLLLDRQRPLIQRLSLATFLFRVVIVLRDGMTVRNFPKPSRYYPTFAIR